MIYVMILYHILRYFPSFLKIIIYRFSGAKIGKCVHFRFGSFLRAKNIVIGDNVIFGKNSHVSANSVCIYDFVNIGVGTKIENVDLIEIDEYSSLKDGVHIRGNSLEEKGSLKIGENAWIGDKAFINVAKNIYMEDNVGIGAESMLWTHGFWPEIIEGYPVTLGEITIKKNSWIAPRTIIMPNITIGENAIVLTGSIVSKNIEPRTMNGGCPSKIIKCEHDYKETYTAFHKLEIMKTYLCDKLVANGYIIRQIDVDVFICSHNKDLFSLVFFERVTKQNIKSLVENHKFDSYIIIVGCEISQDIKDYLSGFKNISIFDLSSKKYRKIQSAAETIVKKLLSDRFARFTKEIY